MVPHFGMSSEPIVVFHYCQDQPHTYLQIYLLCLDNYRMVDHLIQVAQKKNQQKALTKQLMLLLLQIENSN
jgi:hypothetical protein